jgi:branched-chain amino acid transport system ATP-binding protein
VALLRLERIYKDFSGLQVLSGISLEVIKGERHAIIGPNGAGKSTLFNLITGLYKPSSGRIFFSDKNITGWPIHKIARIGVSRSFQVINIFPEMTLFENVRNAIISKVNRRFNWVSQLNRSEEIREESDRIIELIGLTDVRDFPVSELSYGRQRQLELALTLARDPVLIMLDEPTAGLDTEETRAFVHLIKQVIEKKTLVIVEHDMDVVFDLADRITVIHYGKVLATGSPDKIRENEEVKKAYLGRK